MKDYLPPSHFTKDTIPDWKKLADEADDYTDAKLQQPGEYHPDWHDIRDEYFYHKAFNEGLNARIGEIPWLRVIDEALVVAHLDIASPRDSYEEAKKKLHTYSMEY